MKVGGISRLSLALIVVIVLAAGSVMVFFGAQLLNPTPTPQSAPERLAVSGYFADSEGAFLLMDAGRDRGIWKQAGLDPDFVTIPGRAVLAADIKEQVASGIKMGVSIASEVLLARANGVPVKIVAGYVGEAPVKVFVKTDHPAKTIQDLDGKRIGVFSNDHYTYRMVGYLSQKLGVKLEPVAVGDLPSNIAALKTGRTDAFIFGTSSGVALLLVDSGELKILLDMRDVLPKPFVSFVVFATDDIIDSNPDLVKRFVKATLETISYLKENPNYAADLYSRKTAAPKDLADKAVSQLDWRPNGRGSGADLTTAVTNNWQYNKESGAIPPNINVKIEEAVDARFLP